MKHEPFLFEGHAEVRIVAATPEVARRVSEVLRRCFASTEQRSHPAGGEGETRLHSTCDPGPRGPRIRRHLRPRAAVEPEKQS